jgi:hypothetical protein
VFLPSLELALRNADVFGLACSIRSRQASRSVLLVLGVRGCLLQWLRITPNLPVSLDRPADLSAVLCCGHRGLAGGITDWDWPFIGYPIMMAAVTSFFSRTEP